MSVKKANEIFGYGLFIVGALKLLLLILVVLQLGSNIISIFNGGNVNSEYYPTFSTAIGIAQIILAIGSIIMIIVNIKNQPGVIIGYLWGLGAFLIQFITPSIISFYVVFIECGMYMKAGSKIRKKNIGIDKNYRKIKQDMKNTEWFYENSDK